MNEPSNPLRSEKKCLVYLEKVTKDYGKLRALDSVSLSIGPGVTGLLGPNGAGKSTLIKVLLGLVSIHEGTGAILGHPLHDLQNIRAHVGYMPEDDCYVPGLSGVEMVQYMVRLSGRSSTEGLRRSHEILDYCGMGQERYRDVAGYSNGMRQKLKFAQAIVHDPVLLILDEPTAGLDPDERQSMLVRIRKLASDSQKTVLISTHILPDVQSICDDLVIMVNGRISLISPLEVLNRASAPAYRVRVLGNTDKLIARIEEGGYTVTDEGQGSLKIDGFEPDGAGQIWQWASETGVRVHALMSVRNSLEEVFLDAVRESHRADS